MYNFVLFDLPFVGGGGCAAHVLRFRNTRTPALTVTCNCEIRSDTVTVTNCSDTTISSLGHQLLEGGGGCSFVYRTAQIQCLLSSVYFVQFCAESWKFIQDV
jgi:hypothetical protein